VGRKRAKRTAGQGSVFVQGGTTWIRWRQNGRRRTEKFPGTDSDTRDTAERVLARIIGELAARRGKVDPVDPLPAKPLTELWPEFLERRKLTVRSWRDDASRWRCHLGPFFGPMLPDQVGVANVRKFIETRIAKKMSPATIRLCLALLGSLYTDLTERGLAAHNAVRALPRAVRRLTKPDGAFSPFLERQEDIRRIFLALPLSFATMFGLGVLAGLRPGEVLAIEWGDIDLDARRIVVQRQARHGRVGPPKSGKMRFVPIAEPLAKILTEWRLFTGGSGQLFRPEVPTKGGRKDRPPRFVNLHTVHLALRDALRACELPQTLTLYACTRHSFAAHHVLAGGSLSALRELLGHSSTAITERYGRLRSDMLRPAALPTLSVDLSRPRGDVIDMAARRGAVDHGVAMEAVDGVVSDGISTGSI